MKKVLFLVAAPLLAALMSCSSDSASKTISPTATAFADGEVGEYVEVTDGPAELSYVTADDGTQYISLKVTLKMAREGQTRVNAEDVNFEAPLSGATIDLVDKEGTVVEILEVKEADVLKLKKLLTSVAGTTEEITFEGKVQKEGGIMNSIMSMLSSTPSWFSSTTQFTPDQTATVDWGMLGYIAMLSERRLTDADMNISKHDMEIWRNMIYAKYGYKFKRQDLADYFSQFIWYAPMNGDAAVAYDQMTDIEKYNVEFIKKYEAKPKNRGYVDYFDFDSYDAF